MSSAETSLVADGILAGKYRLIELLGKGGMGEVWLAENTDIGRKVAIKVLHAAMAGNDAMRARFRQEARVASAIGHPGICDVLDMGTTENDELFIVMEALSGESLGERLERTRRLPLTAVLPIMEPVLAALAAAHDAGVVHRDLKPDNLFVTDKPTITTKILDFGISKLAGAGDDSLSLTQTGAVMGTPYYMSPEQARGARDVGPATDLYAVGAILYQALTASPPFPGTSYNEVLAKLLTESPTPLAEVRKEAPAELSALIDSMLAKDADQRPPDARAVLGGLRSAMSGVTGAVALDATLAPGVESAPAAATGVDAGMLAPTVAPESASASESESESASASASVSESVSESVSATVSSRRPTWLAIPLVLAALGGLALVLLKGGDGASREVVEATPPDAATLSPIIAAPTAPPKTVELTLIANVADAEFFFDGDMESPCPSPCKQRGVVGELRDVLVRASGHRDVTRAIRFERDGLEIEIRLERRATTKPVVRDKPDKKPPGSPPDAREAAKPPPQGLELDKTVPF